MLPHDLLAAFGIPAFLILIGMENRDQVVQLATPQRIVHKMGTRAGPQDDVGTPEIFGDVLALEHRTIGNVARYPRLAVTDQGLADLRPHAVAADQGAAFDRFSIVKSNRDVVAMI